MHLVNLNSLLMERLSSLIHKLKEQFQENVPADQMLLTVRLIESELSSKASPTNGHRNSGKVSVMMPAGMKSVVAQEITDQHVKYAPPVIEELAEIEEEVVKPVEKNGVHPARKPDQSGWLFDPLQEIPTLAHQQSGRELNDIMGSNGASVNDRLREDKTEFGHLLTEHPLRDLKKGIGVNDRFVFLNELFRGDETMYERSLKTINGFRILPEAEYWINRELKIKLAWNEENSTVKQFYQLVRRRFS